MLKKGYHSDSSVRSPLKAKEAWLVSQSLMLMVNGLLLMANALRLKPWSDSDVWSEGLGKASKLDWIRLLGSWPWAHDSVLLALWRDTQGPGRWATLTFSFWFLIHSFCHPVACLDAYADVAIGPKSICPFPKKCLSFMGMEKWLIQGVLAPAVPP